MKVGRTAVVTDTGRRRRGNEDAYVFEPPLFGIADGMGGARAGEVAAGLAAAALQESGGDPGGADGLAEIIADANRRIWERSLSDPETTGMGTTVTVALVDAATGTIVSAHVGDSRAYRLREGSIEQVTTDHSLVAELVQSGILTPEEAERHPQRSAITRALGTEPDVEADIFTIQGEPGDLFLLCSDGLSDMLSEEEIAAAVDRAGRDPQAAGKTLVAAANANGGEDNITVVLFELVEDDAPDAPVDASATDGVPATTPATPGTPEAPRNASLSRHGAGKGGRVAALLLVLGIVALAVLALYWGVSR